MCNGKSLWDGDLRKKIHIDDPSLIGPFDVKQKAAESGDVIVLPELNIETMAVGTPSLCSFPAHFRCIIIEKCVMPSPSDKPNSKNQNYALHGALHGHSGAVVCLDATEDGKLLASGGKLTPPLLKLAKVTQPRMGPDFGILRT